ncbi:MAG: tRNA pseudouridine(55) synthase, partial [Lentisphaerae bacterium]|nr:tRNA pseudouridine(55) synthase [Lentisphaerota bacterium]
MVSAVKKDGVPLYKLARKGKTVEREPRLIHVFEFNSEKFIPPDIRFRLRCSKGVYVRTLCADIGTALGCGAHLKQLRRLESGKFNVEAAHSLDNILQMDIEQLANSVIPLHKVIEMLT